MKIQDIPRFEEVRPLERHAHVELNRTVVCYGLLQIEEEQQISTEVSLDGTVLELTEDEFNFLRALTHAPLGLHTFVELTRLLGHASPSVAAIGHVTKVACALRTKLGSPYIVLVRGEDANAIGYQLIA